MREGRPRRQDRWPRRLPPPGNDRANAASPLDIVPYWAARRDLARPRRGAISYPLPGATGTPGIRAKGMSRPLEAAPSGSNSLGRVVVALVGRMADVEPTNRVRMSRNVLHDSPCIAPMGVHTFPRSYIPRTFTFLSGLVLEREPADRRAVITLSGRFSSQGAIPTLCSIGYDKARARSGPRLRPRLHTPSASVRSHGGTPYRGARCLGESCRRFP